MSAMYSAHAQEAMRAGNRNRARELLIETIGALADEKLELKNRGKEEWYDDQISHTEQLFDNLIPDAQEVCSNTTGQTGTNPHHTSRRAPESVDTSNHNVPDKTYDDVYGLKDLKDKVKRRFILPYAHPDKSKGIQRKKHQIYGFILYGPPGTGKTHFAEATAGEIAEQLGEDVYFTSLFSSDVKDSLVGQSVKNLRAQFENAAKNEPAVMFFDEVSGLAPMRDNDKDPYGSELTEEFLSDFSIIQGKKVFVIAATNRPWDLDSAIMRPGRLTQVQYMPVPDLEARAGIFDTICDGLDLADDVDFYALAEVTDGYTGSDIEAICEEAISTTRQDRIENDNMRPMTMLDFINAVNETDSSVKDWIIDIRRSADKLGTKYKHLLDEADRLEQVLYGGENN